MTKKVNVPIDNQHGMGWIKSKPDSRDTTHPKVLNFWKYFIPVENLPESVDLRSGCIPVMDQLSLGSCTACAADALCGYRLLKEGHPLFQGSRLTTYYFTRLAEGTPNEDSGAEIRDTIKTIADYGLADEKLWPYDISKFTIKPPQNVIADAAQRKAITYIRIDQDGMVSADVINAMKQQLAAGNTMEFGTYCYQSIFSTGSDGMIPVPKKNESPVGGHAMMICGYDNSKKAFLLQNSWGKSFGIDGFGYLPFSYFETGYQGQPDASDVWVILTENWPADPTPQPEPNPNPVPPNPEPIPPTPDVKPDITITKAGNYSVYLASMKNNVVGDIIFNGKSLGPVAKLTRSWYKPLQLGSFKEKDTLTFSLKLPDGSMIHNNSIVFDVFWKEWELKMAGNATSQARKYVVLGIVQR